SVISGSSSFIQGRLVHSGSKRPRSLHRNAARHGFGAPRNGDMEHAVAIICGYCVGIHILGQADRTAKTPGETLIDVDHGPVTLGRHRRGALPGDGEGASFEVDFDGRGIQSGGVDVQLDALRRTADVDRWKAAAAGAPNAWSTLKSLLQLPMQAIEIGKYIAGKK